MSESGEKSKKDLDAQLWRYVFTLTAPEGYAEDAMIAMSGEILNHLTDVVKAKKFSYQIERGKVAGKLHFQGRYNLWDKSTIRKQLEKWQITGVTRGWYFDINKEYGKEHQSIMYTKKSDTAIEGTFVNDVSVLNATSYKGDDLYLKSDLPEYFWQRQLEAHLKDPFGYAHNAGVSMFGLTSKQTIWGNSSNDIADIQHVKPHLWANRMIDVLSCAGGAEGKSTFQKRLVYQNPGKVLFIPVSDTISQVLSAFVNFVEHNAYIGPEIVLIDIPRAIDHGDRAMSNMIKIHNCAEILRSGLVCSTMYGKYKSICVTPPRILICTNHVYALEDYLWAPPNRYAIHKLVKDPHSHRTIVAGLRQDVP
jgi:hypothetical protein